MESKHRIQEQIEKNPRLFLQKLPYKTDLKSLNQIHRILHSWWDNLIERLQSGQPVSPSRLRIGQYTLRWIKICHDKLVEHMKELDPDWKHESPMEWPTGLLIESPDTALAAKDLLDRVANGPDQVLLVSNYLWLIGSAVPGKKAHPGDIDILIRDNDVPQYVADSFYKVVGKEKAGLIEWVSRSSGPHDDAVPLYDLALVKKKPIEVKRVRVGVNESTEAPQADSLRGNQIKVGESRLAEFKDIEGYDARKSTNAQLGDDLRLAMAHYATLKDPDKDIKYTEEQLVAFITKLLKEIIRRKRAGKMKYTLHPDRLKPAAKELYKKAKLTKGERAVLEKETMREAEAPEGESLPTLDGLYLVPKHAELIWEGRKKAVVKSRQYDVANKELYLLGGDKVYGIIVLGEPEPISIDEFEKRKDAHLVSDEERRQWWPDTKRLYYYPIKKFEKFDPLMRYSYKQGVQVVQKNITPVAPASAEAATVTESTVPPDKLDLGCGANKPEGFFGIDIEPLSGVDLVHDVTEGLPFPDNAISVVRAHHFLEHIPQDKVIFVMGEIWRVLKPGGILEFEVPSTDGRNAFMLADHKSYWNILSFYQFCDNKFINISGFKGKFGIEHIETVEDPKAKAAWVRGRLFAIK